MSLIERLLTELLPLKGCRSHPETQSGTAQSSGVKVGLHPGPAVWPPAECLLPQCRTRPRRNGVRVPAGLVGRAGPPVPRHVPARQREPSSPGNAGHCQPVGGRVGRWAGPAPASSGGPPSPVQRDDPAAFARPRCESSETRRGTGSEPSLRRPLPHAPAPGSSGSPGYGTPTSGAEPARTGRRLWALEETTVGSRRHLGGRDGARGTGDEEAVRLGQAPGHRPAAGRAPLRAEGAGHRSPPWQRVPATVAGRGSRGSAGPVGLGAEEASGTTGHRPRLSPEHQVRPLPLAQAQGCDAKCPSLQWTGAQH